MAVFSGEVSIVLLIVDVAAKEIIVVPRFLPTPESLLENVVLAWKWIALHSEFAKALVIKGTGLRPHILHLGLKLYKSRLPPKSIISPAHIGIGTSHGLGVSYPVNNRKDYLALSRQPMFSKRNG